MFDGVAEQFHRFISAASTRTTSLSHLPLSFPSPTLHHHHQHHHGSPLSAAALTFPPPLDPALTFNHQQIPPLPPLQPPHTIFHSLHHSSSSLQQHANKSTATAALKQDNNKNNCGAGSMVVGLDSGMEGGIITSNIPTDHHRRCRHHHPVDDQDHHPWSSDEVIALFRIRSNMENWFPEFSWEHVSRKFAELGFKRSAEKCKEKFEEESSYFNNININQNNYTKINGSYRVFSDDLEELYTDHDDHDDHADDDNQGSNHQHHHHGVSVEKNETMEEKPSEEEDKNPGQNNSEENKDQDDQTVEINPSDNHGSDDEIKSKKRKREEEQKKKKIKKEKFEMFKGFCEEVVKKMMTQQEEMHNKLLEDMLKRDEEKIAREEMWKKKEIERINKELDMRAQEQAISGERQSTIINFLNNLTPAGIFEGTTTRDLAKVLSKNISSTCYDNSLSSSSSLVNLPQNPNPPPPNPSNSDHHRFNYSQNNDDQRLQPKSSTIFISCPSQDDANPTVPDQNHTLKIPTLSPRALTPQDPNSLNSQNNLSAPTSLYVQKPAQNPKSTINEKEDIGKRWPRDEVLALINLRCSLYNNNHDQDHKEGSSSSGSSSKAPLWERISQGMLELGYKRSAKRCKEKWENINKYFRKTRDVNKKRSVDSRTCPYFQQLSTMYNQGTLVAPPSSGGGSENLPTFPEKNSDSPKILRSGASQGGSNYTDPIVHVNPQGEKSVVQIPSYDFDF